MPGGPIAAVDIEREGVPLVTVPIKPRSVAAMGLS